MCEGPCVIRLSSVQSFTALGGCVCCLLMAGALVFCTDYCRSLGTVESGVPSLLAPLCFKGVSVAGGTSLVA